MANPTGGVRKLVCKQTANKMVNQIGSNPSALTTGDTKGSTINVNSIQSKKKPSRNVASRIQIIMPVLPKGKPSSDRSISSSPPSPRSTKENAVAPNKIAKMKAVVLVVS